MERKGILFVLSGPSGAGKGTVCKALMDTKTPLKLSISVTTRSPRDGEQEGLNYFFRSVAEFEEMIAADALLEWAKVYNNFYGTPRSFVEQQLAAGHDVFLEIDIQGAMQVKRRFPNGVFIFLIPPSQRELESRILGRGSETTESFNIRTSAARDELQKMREYDYVVVNDVVADACVRIRSIIEAEHAQVRRNLYLIENW
ncbi:guanylate kinase [Alicyclobacillus fodiniaquatilis]|jgi:guanylate kinase|uniref:Guanylate kinase n=1 Tax=Alicyclobacillus fodiniaquatilis TaxID=1661150 RepID=A0ABW4JMQ4_9BACL